MNFHLCFDAGATHEMHDCCPEEDPTEWIKWCGMTADGSQVALSGEVRRGGERPPIVPEAMPW